MPPRVVSEPIAKTVRGPEGLADSTLVLVLAAVQFQVRVLFN